MIEDLSREEALLRLAALGTVLERTTSVSAVCKIIGLTDDILCHIPPKEVDGVIAVRVATLGRIAQGRPASIDEEAEGE
jgi:hypothetical protein